MEKYFDLLSILILYTVDTYSITLDLYPKNWRDSCLTPIIQSVTKCSTVVGSLPTYFLRD